MAIFAMLAFMPVACGDDEDQDLELNEQENQVEDEKPNKEETDPNGTPNEDENNQEGNDDNNGSQEEQPAAFECQLSMPKRNLYYAGEESFFVYVTSNRDFNSLKASVVDESGVEVACEIIAQSGSYVVYTPDKVGTFNLVVADEQGNQVKSAPFGCIGTETMYFSVDEDHLFFDLENNKEMTMEEALANPSSVTLVAEDGKGLLSPSESSIEAIRTNGNSIEFHDGNVVSSTGFTKQFKMSNGKEGLLTFTTISRNGNGAWIQIGFNYSFK